MKCLIWTQILLALKKPIFTTQNLPRIDLIWYIGTNITNMQTPFSAQRTWWQLCSSEAMVPYIIRQHGVITHKTSHQHTHHTKCVHVITPYQI
jgi:hypothetical protein